MGSRTFIASKLKLKSKAVMISTAVSFIVMIIALAVASGFRFQIRSSLAAMCGDLRVTSTYGVSEAAGIPLDASSGIFKKIAAVKGVKELRPVIYRGGIFRASDDMHGVIFRAAENLADSIVIVPRKLSSLLCLKPSDNVLSYFVGENGTLSVRKFKLGGIYEGIVTSDDKLVVQCSPSVLRRINGWKDNEVSAVEVVLDEECLSGPGSAAVEEDIDRILFTVNDGSMNDLRCENVRQSYSQLFDWLNLIDANVSFILILMIVVAGFNMITGLLIFLFENMKTIGLLKSLGMRGSAISCSFLLSAARSVFFGMLAGNVLSLAFCMVQDHTRFLTLNPENYFIAFVPVRLDFMTLLSCDLVAFVFIMLALTIPCAFIAKLQPTVTLRSE